MAVFDTNERTLASRTPHSLAMEWSRLNWDMLANKMDLMKSTAEPKEEPKIISNKFESKL